MQEYFKKQKDKITEWQKMKYQRDVEKMKNQ